MMILLIIYVLAECCRVSYEIAPPYPFSWRDWVDFRSYRHLVNLTEYLVKDVTLKLRHAEKVQEKHKHSITFELGSIAAAILDKFKNMLEIYRKFSSDMAIKERKYMVLEYMYAFHTLQGDFNEIRLEEGMFFHIVRAFESTRAATTKVFLPPGFTLPKGHARRLWSVNPRTFDF